MYLPLGSFKFLSMAFLFIATAISLFSQNKVVETFPFEKNKSIQAIEQSLFTEIPDASSGLSFKLPLDKKGVRELDSNPFFVTRKQAIGVCAGDFDNDGLDDVFFAHSYGGHQLFRNLVGLKFKDITEELNLSEIFKNHWAVGCSFVDINGDGWLDLFIAGTGDPNLVLINQSGNSFLEMSETLGLKRRGASVQMAFSDFDRDGDLDAYLITNRLSTLPSPKNGMQVMAEMERGKVQVEDQYDEVFTIVPHPQEKYRVVNAGERDLFYRNDGGKFIEMSEALGFDGTDEGLAASWIDYDRDGWLDLYVANDFYGSDQLYRNVEGKHFEEQTHSVLPHVPWFSMGTDVGDINNDGWFDLMTSDMAGSDHYKSKMGMGDMEESGWFLRSSNPKQYMRNSLYLNSGKGRFLEIAQQAGVANTDWTWSVKLADLDNDGWLDLIGTNGMMQDRTNSDLLNKAKLLKTQEERIKFWKKFPPKKDENFIFKNLDGLSFQKMGNSGGFNYRGVSFGMALADFDRDGDLDAVVASMDSPYKLYRNNASSSASVTIRLRGKKENKWAIGSTVRITTELGSHWRNLSSSQGYASANSPILHFGLGKAKEIREVEITWPTGEVQTISGISVNAHHQVNQDDDLGPSTGKPTEIETTFREDTLLTKIRHNENHVDDFDLQPLLPYRLSRLGPGLAWGDVDGDDDLDLFMGQSRTSGSELYLRQADGTFVKKEQKYFSDAQLIPFKDMGSLFLDADSDGDLDLYVVSGGYDPSVRSLYLRDRLFLNQGEGDFVLGLPNTPDLRDAGGTVCAADFDRDGDLDLFVGGRMVSGKYPLTPESRLLVNQGGVFSNQTETLSHELVKVGLVNSAVWSDYDGDGWIDLLVASEWGPIRVWKNENGKLSETTESLGLSKTKGWWTSILPVDFDSDGDMDYAVGNLGYNTKYTASIREPLVLHWGDMDGSGKPRLIEACFKSGKFLPIRGKSCSTNAIPSLAEKFKTFHAFASAELTEIYQPKFLDQSLRIEINELASGIWVNQGDKFRFQKFPSLAQTSAVFGMAQADFNGDGWTDICLAQNFFPMQPETGRVNGGIGILMLGSKTGLFTPEYARESGLVIPNDATSLSLVDLDSDHYPDLVVTNNNQYTQTFINQGRGAPPLLVMVKGMPGNLRGAGSRLKVFRKSGAAEVIDITLGLGYLTGNEPQAWVSRRANDPLVYLVLTDPAGRQHKLSPSLMARTVTFDLSVEK
ncbi:MAG: VCBS repeat-containing protein [Verrucomicrobiota bacterium]|nr:VCBS repeat-containing protein [Verrucomicrobiota bacterium]